MNRQSQILLIISVLILSAFAGRLAGTWNILGLYTLGGVLGSALLIAFILKQPYIGLLVILVLAPLEDTIHKIAPYNIVLLTLGIVTLLSYLINSRKLNRERDLFSFGPPPLQLIMGIGFVIWIFLSYPEGWLIGRTPTFVQLIVLLVLASRLLETVPQKHLVSSFVIVNCLAAATAYFEVTQVDYFVRSGGLQGNSNTFAFYVVISMIFNLVWLQLPNRLPTWIHLMLFAFLCLGVVASGSRTGLITLILGLLLIAVVWPLIAIPREFSYKSGSTGSLRMFLLIGLLALVQFFVPTSYIDAMTGQLTELEQDNSTQVRLALLNEGIEMWLDHPLSGVGISQFSEYSRVGNQTAHNIYVVLLSETGIIGFILFLGMILGTLIDFVKLLRRAKGDDKALIWGWFTIMIIILVRGLTASTLHYDKLLWAIVGISLFYNRKYLYRDHLATGINQN